MLAEALARGRLRCTTDPVEPIRVRYGDRLCRYAQRSRWIA